MLWQIITPIVLMVVGIFISVYGIYQEEILRLEDESIWVKIGIVITWLSFCWLIALGTYKLIMLVLGV